MKTLDVESKKNFKIVDPIKVTLDKYPRILVIKAAFETLKEGNKVTLIELEKKISILLNYSYKYNSRYKQ
ncbi:hypothetical protein XO10_00285 [Marinitoga sp. 1135]|uniref:Uncharacterized protein n=1 Tax=Marinitoga piezophila (strain DSM 14283 / JCM 11233 / KA3) TaxID=443254 RepID=H2J2S1_MARPK|nr:MULTISPECIES: hypothetical protein [Marinitoga]AEX84515.1 hypothetical protein Marpi_0057 [Marinitoga piezophila KA3]APT75008.1 hypothetical protein LN42_00285 [Marinitoga sp. 1137]NUU94764.1 hypothetical protein [Marinitoga sp. 1135]NUU96693.1 hypothetical protein [Marinitoga sp. 1138]